MELEEVHNPFLSQCIESIIRHGGDHSVDWRPACPPQTQNKPSAMGGSGGGRSRTVSFSPSSFVPEIRVRQL